MVFDGGTPTGLTLVAVAGGERTAPSGLCRRAQYALARRTDRGCQARACVCDGTLASHHRLIGRFVQGVVQGVRVLELLTRERTHRGCVPSWFWNESPRRVALLIQQILLDWSEPYSGHRRLIARRPFSRAWDVRLRPRVHPLTEHPIVFSRPVGRTFGVAPKRAVQMVVLVSLDDLRDPRVRDRETLKWFGRIRRQCRSVRNGASEYGWSSHARALRALLAMSRCKGSVQGVRVLERSP